MQIMKLFLGNFNMKLFVGKFNDYSNKNNPDYWVEKAEINAKKAIKYYRKAIKAYTKKNEEEKSAEIYDKIGKVYSDKGNNLNEAIRSFQASLRIYESKENNEQIKQCHFNIGKAYLKNRQFEESEKSFESALELGSDAKFCAEINYQIGLIYVYKKKESSKNFLRDLNFLSFDSIGITQEYREKITQEYREKITQEYREKIAPFNKKIIEKFNQVLSFYSESENEINSQYKLNLNILIADAYEENGKKDSSLNHYKVCLKILQSSANLVDDQDKQMEDLKKKIASLSPRVEIASRVVANQKALVEAGGESSGQVGVGGSVISPPILKENESKNFIEEIPDTIIKIINFFGCGCSQLRSK
jgi:tetratricopeptide (TPR) repeat protein